MAAPASRDVAKVLTEVKILGHGICMAGMQTVMGKAGAGNVDMSTIEGAASRKQTIKECERDPSQHLRLLLGNGNSGHSEQGSGNANELVNPRQTV